MAKKPDRPGAGEKIEGVGSQMRDDLGKPSKITRAKRKAAPGGVQRSPVTPSLMEQVLAAKQTDLRAKGKGGQPLPTLQDRIKTEGFRKQLSAGMARAKRAQAKAAPKATKPKRKRKAGKKAAQSAAKESTST